MKFHFLISAVFTGHEAFNKNLIRSKIKIINYAGWLNGWKV